MDGLKPLESLKLTCNVKSNWHAFKQRFQLHSETLGLDSKPDSKKVALELTIADPQAVKSKAKAEKGVHILKQILKNTSDSDSDPYLALLTYRASPLE
ncbi:uncharacterized protein K02A2.6-like isoform X1 [Tachysurus ichikawai]